MTKGSAESISDTRAIKALKHLQDRAPTTIPRSSLSTLERLPSSVLADLHATSDWNSVTGDARLKSWLADNPVPVPTTRTKGPLFHGTLVFVRVTFHETRRPLSAIKLADVQTAVRYATLAAIPITRYASQYGPNSVGVSPDVIPFTAQVSGGNFTIAEFEGWVDQCAQIAGQRHIA